MIEHVKLALDGSKAAVATVLLGAVVLGPPALVLHDMLQKLPGATPTESTNIVFGAMFDLMPWIMILMMAFMMLGVMRRV